MMPAAAACAWKGARDGRGNETAGAARDRRGNDAAAPAYIGRQLGAGERQIRVLGQDGNLVGVVVLKLRLVDVKAALDAWTGEAGERVSSCSGVGEPQRRGKAALRTHRWPSSSAFCRAARRPCSGRRTRPGGGNGSREMRWPALDGVLTTSVPRVT